MADFRDIVVDCRHPASLARFWAALLDGYDVAPYDDAELARLRARGILDPEDDPSVLVEAPGRRPRLFFQLVPEGKHGKNRLHLDVTAPNVDAEVERVVALGARVLAVHDDDDTRWTTCADPEGNEFCVFPEG